MTQQPLDKVTATDAALELLSEIIRDHGPVMFHQSGGCCDGSSPMCFRCCVIGRNRMFLATKVSE